MLNPRVAAALGAYSDADIYARLCRIREGARTTASQSPKLAEVHVFSSGRHEIGLNNSDAKLYARTLPREAWDLKRASCTKPIRSLVVVHRLREVSCLYGFNLIQAAPTSAEGDIEDIQLAVRSAPISQSADWSRRRAFRRRALCPFLCVGNPGLAESGRCSTASRTTDLGIPLLVQPNGRKGAKFSGYSLTYCCTAYRTP